MKKLISILLAVVLLISICPTILAYEFPHSIWEPLDAYSKAFESGDHHGVLNFGKVITDIMESQPDSHTKNDFLSGKYYQMAQSAEALKDYNLAISYYKKYLPYGTAMGFSDGVSYAKNKITLLQPVFDVFVENGGTAPYYGAKFEPKNGVLFGSTYDTIAEIGNYNTSDIQKYYNKRNSVYIMYLNFFDDMTTIERYGSYLNQIKEGGHATLEFAWNYYEPITNIASHDAYIRKTLDYLDSFDIPIFLRFGCEMNISKIGDNKEAYVESFRYVAKIAKEKKNIAVVWSPNDVGALDKPFGNFYPGDEYVDWIGVSMYVIPYFNGQKDHGTQTDPLDTFFITGPYSNPLMKITPIIEFMNQRGIKKPIMISEGGAANYVRTVSENTTNFAKEQMKKMYVDLLLKYPQIKSIIYFNVSMPHEPNDYELHSKPEMRTAYNMLVSENKYLMDDYKNEPIASYAQFNGGTFSNKQWIKFETASYYPKQSTTVKCYLNGAEIPYIYGFYFSFQELAPGRYPLDFYLIDSNQNILLDRKFSVDILEGANVTINSANVEFIGQQPVIIDGRTLIPVRGVTEHIGMNVSWDNDKQMAVLANNDVTIELVINSSNMVIKKNGETINYPLSTPAQLINGRTMLPLRAIVDAIDGTVEWVEETQTAIITKNM